MANYDSPFPPDTPFALPAPGRRTAVDNLYVGRHRASQDDRANRSDGVAAPPPAWAVTYEDIVSATARVRDRLHGAAMLLGPAVSGASEAVVNPVLDMLGSLHWESRRLLDRASSAEADYHGACATIAEMHAAATGRVGEGPHRGVVEDVADVAARADRLATALADDNDWTQQALDAWAARVALLEEALQYAYINDVTWARERMKEAASHTAALPTQPGAEPGVESEVAGGLQNHYYTATQVTEAADVIAPTDVDDAPDDVPDELGYIDDDERLRRLIPPTVDG